MRKAVSGSINTSFDMDEKRGTPESAPQDTGAKVGNISEITKDSLKVLEYFRYTTGTTLDCAKATGVLRNSITWYVAEFEKLRLLQAVCVKPDVQTGFKAKHYSADPSQWARVPASEQSLFQESEMKG